MWCDIFREFERDFEVSCEVYCLIDGKIRKEEFFFGVYDDLVMISFCFFSCYWFIVNFIGDVGVFFFFVGKYVEEGSVIWFRMIEDKEYFFWFDIIMVVVEDCFEWWFMLRFFDKFWNVELGDDVFMDSSIGGDNLDGEILLGYIKGLVWKVRCFILFFEGNDFWFECLFGFFLFEVVNRGLVVDCLWVVVVDFYCICFIIWCYCSNLVFVCNGLLVKLVWRYSWELDKVWCIMKWK